MASRLLGNKSLMNPNRDLKILFSALSGGFLLLAGFTNMTDYGTNFSFVQKVVRMEELFSGETLRWRRLESAWMHHALYVCIILWELACGTLAVLGAWRMFKVRSRPASDFARAMVPSTYAYGLAVALWFGGFVTVAGEWFLMWRGEETSGAQGTALHLTAVFLLLLLCHAGLGHEESGS